MAGVDWAYTSLMVLALATCSLLLRRTQTTLQLTTQQKLGIGVGAFCGAMVGAKLPFLFVEWSNGLGASSWLADGKTIMFGIVGGYIGVELAKWSLEVRTKTGDTFAVPVAVGVAIGRLACFVGGCCYGKPTSLPWGMAFASAMTDPTVPRHPTQLYEAAFHFSLAGLLLWFAERGMFHGQRVKLYIISYLLYRFATEFIRPEPRIWLGLTAYQFAALAMLPVFVWLWRRDSSARRAD